MTYTAEISRTNPSCFLFLIDQSGSMMEVIDPTEVHKLDRPVVLDGRRFTHEAVGRTKAEGVADAINRFLQNLVIKCAKSEGVRDYYDVGVIGYGARVGPALGGALSERDLAKISEIANSPMRIEERKKKVDDGAGSLVDQAVKFPVWIDPVAESDTPMCKALNRAYDILLRWVTGHQSSFPPIVINISDGESTDGDPTRDADNVKQLSTQDGSVLLFNVHISASRGTLVDYPDSESGLPDSYSQLLFRISSRLPEHMRLIRRADGRDVSENTRGFVYNSDMVALIKFIDIGTRPSNLR